MRTLPDIRVPSESMARPNISFWCRHKTLINFWLDVALLILFLIQAFLLAVIEGVFPRGAGPEWTVWGASQLEWLDGLLTAFCVFALGVTVHVMLHWSWICGTVATRLLGRKGVKDDGTLTIIGVCLLIGLIHLILAGVLAARICLIGKNV